MEQKSFSTTGRLLLLLIIGVTKAQEDSLRSALDAVNNRQRNLSPFAGYEDEAVGEYGSSPNGLDDDLEFLPYYNSERDIEKNPAFQRLLLEYLDGGNGYPEIGNEEEVKKRLSSSFRERLEEDKERQMEEILDNYLSNAETEEDYTELVRELWEKYRASRPREVKKRPYYYPKFGLDGAGLRKRSKYRNYQESVASYGNPLYLQAYSDRNDDYLDKYQDDDSQQQHASIRDRKFDPRLRSNSYYFSYPAKRFPVSKRSSYKAQYYDGPEITHEHKRSTSKKESAIKTDPKVAKELSGIFGTVTEKPVTSTKTAHQEKEKSANQAGSKKTSSGTSKKKDASNSKSHSNASKEVVAGVPSEETSNIHVHKKAVDWSQYFGLDKRKRSGQIKEEIDPVWLMDRYNKATSTTKRNAEYPLDSFKDRDQAANKKDALAPEEQKISEIDEKLKNMEETIIDDAMKYTGAHEGTVDAREIQEVKDKIITRLAAAYNLEKMRRALGEYKLTIAKERQRIKQQQQQQRKQMPADDYDFAEEKRVSVPRKQAVEEEKEKHSELDNTIKCAQEDENCEEQNYRAPAEVLEQVSYEECPKVQRACNEASAILGHYARIFETACNMHQMCLLCSNNSWFAPTRQCNVLFLSKAYELCDGKLECQMEAHRSVKYLMDVNRSLRMDPLDGCELACPDKR